MKSRKRLISWIPLGFIQATLAKTDQEGAGHSISLDYRMDRVCPVQALKDWLDSAYLVSGPVFLSFYKWDRPHYGKAIDPRNIAGLFKKLARAINLPNWEFVSGEAFFEPLPNRY